MARPQRHTLVITVDAAEGEELTFDAYIEFSATGKADCRKYEGELLAFAAQTVVNHPEFKRFAIKPAFKKFTAEAETGDTAMRDDRICDGGKPTCDAGESGMIPNSFQVPNLYADRLMALLTPEEWKVLTYAARRIFGFRKRQDRISLSQFTDGTETEQGQRLDYGTGLGRDTAAKCLRSLCGFRVLIQTDGGNKAKHIAAEYRLQEDARGVDWAGLEVRRKQSEEANQRRTAGARGQSDRPRKNLSDRPRNAVGGTDLGRSVPPTAASLSDRPTKPSRNQEETQTILPAGQQNADPVGVGGAPSEMPDGTFRLTDAQLEALDALNLEVTSTYTMDPEARHAYRVLFRDGLTVEGLNETVRGIIAQRKERDQEPVTSMKYFIRPLQRWIETEKGARAESQRTQSDTGGAAEPEKRKPCPRSLAGFIPPDEYFTTGRFPKDWMEARLAEIKACWGSAHLPEQTREPWQGVRH